jgi:ribosomal protein S18 acetylase RimI-like enzyme
MEYRKAILSDIDTLSSLRVDMLCEESPLSGGQREIIEDNTRRFFLNGFTDHSVIGCVAVVNQYIVCMGYVNFFSFPPNDWCPNGKTAYVGNMYTLPDFRGKGIASNVLSNLIGEAKARECQRILLHTTDMGRLLYKKFGFEDSTTAMAFYPFGINPLT